MVLAFSEEGDLEREEKKDVTFTTSEVGLPEGAPGQPSPGQCLTPPPRKLRHRVAEQHAKATQLICGGAGI